MKVQTNNPCFICKSEDSRLLIRKEYPEHDYPGGFKIMKCDQCGLLFNSPRLTDDEIAALYGKNYYFFHRTDENEFERIVGLYQRTISLIKDSINTKKVLEIGSSKGYLLSVLRHQGWDVQGVEISSEASSYAKNKFKIPTD